MLIKKHYRSLLPLISPHLRRAIKEGPINFEVNLLIRNKSVLIKIASEQIDAYECLIARATLPSDSQIIIAVIGDSPFIHLRSLDVDCSADYDCATTPPKIVGECLPA